MASARARDWRALESKLALPDTWAEWSEIERKIFALLRGTSPRPTAVQIANELDLSTADVQGAIDRLEMRTAAPAKRVAVGRMLKLIETAAERVLLAMDHRRVDDADLKSLSATMRDLINARALLLGEPTQIVGSDHRRQMNDVVQMLLVEARRRGISFDHDPVSGQIVSRRPVTIDAQGRPS